MTSPSQLAGTAPTATLPCTHAIPSLTYRDATAAIRWLVEVLGADARAVYPGPDDSIAHAELWFGTACVMLGSERGDSAIRRGTGRTTIYLVLASREAVDALHARVAAAGACVPIALHDTPYGSRDFACLDPEGNAWCFGTYAPPAGP